MIETNPEANLQEVAFPLDPKSTVEEVHKNRDREVIAYAWNITTAAAALADKRMIDKPGVIAGIHTQVVSELLTSYALYDIAPAAMYEFYPYDNGEVYANWANRNNSLFFASLARKEIIHTAQADEDIQRLFEQGIMVQTVESYINDLSQGLADLIPSDDFPYRMMRSANEIRDFWSYIINGNERHPGLLEAAAFAEVLKGQWLESLSLIYGEGAPKVAQYMQAILYLKTSKRKSSETVSEIITPLIESFNERDADSIKQTLVDFSRRRYELVSAQTLRLLELDKVDLISEREKEAASKQYTVDPEKIDKAVYGSLEEKLPYGNDIRSNLDINLNSWVDDNVAHTFLRGRNRLTLVGATDQPLSGRVSTMGPHLIFVSLTGKGTEEPAVKITVLSARQILREMRGVQPKIVDAGEHIPTNEELAYYLLETEPKTTYGPRPYYWMAARGMLVNRLRKLRSENQGSPKE